MIPDSAARGGKGCMDPWMKVSPQVGRCLIPQQSQVIHIPEHHLTLWTSTKAMELGPVRTFSTAATSYCRSTPTRPPSTSPYATLLMSHHSSLVPQSQSREGCSFYGKETSNKMSKNSSRNRRQSHPISTVFLILILYLKSHLNHRPSLTSVGPASTSQGGHPQKARNTHLSSRGRLSMPCPCLSSRGL